MESRRRWTRPSLRTALPAAGGAVLLACTASPFGTFDCSTVISQGWGRGCCAPTALDCTQNYCNQQ